ncbi:Aldehyde/histidinol dehydrogenase [Aspergillus minisclerotigenes]|uniref:Aldehyde/histidinol dehydrogenase n=1 Tax=Aspergillus minisclerotigenes TaxID=656917 RepID=A0A5N6JMD9_9EURO|nr:Aldehyde/histidinol dehydrogenase [Aspergillus minisclerotigenes]
MMRPLTLTRAAGLNRLRSRFLSYAKGSPERTELSETIQKMKNEFPATIPIKINGAEVETKQSRSQVNPSRHKDIVANYALATPDQVNIAVDAALKAKPPWETTPFEDRAAIFLRACELIAGKYRSEMVAATMLGQGKNIWQAEIDAPAETVDFFRYYVQEAWALYSQRPKVHPDGNWNKLEYRPLEGFAYAITPFNFTALGATLVGPAALLGNVVIWKPSDSALHASWLLHKILLEAGLPKGVIQFLPGDAEEVTNTILKRPEFSALTSIGYTATFKGIQKKIGDGIGQGIYNSYPRVGQKCSTNSRVYVAESVWPEFQQHLKEETEALKRSLDKLNDFIEAARTDSELELITGAKASKKKGYYVHPTIYKTSNLHHDIMKQELFGPILGVYVYPDAEWEETLKLLDTASRYGLTGSIYARDPYASRQAQTALKHAAGMLYLNTKCTGSTVAQQPFGGSRDSGTNDKTGTMAHLQRFRRYNWVSCTTHYRTLADSMFPIDKGNQSVLYGCVGPRSRDSVPTGLGHYIIWYLKGSKANVENHIKLAAQEGWSLGIKLVRGASVVCCKSVSSKDFQVFDVGICD